MSQVQLGIEESKNNDPLLTVKNLCVNFSRQILGLRRRESAVIRAVNDVSFTINKSEVVAVVGESGSGKTTLARCILQLVNPTSGSIIFDGKEVTKLRGKELEQFRKDVQIIYQDPFESLTPRLNVHDTLAIPLRQLLGMKNEGEITQNIKTLLDEVGLDPLEVIYRYPHQLSGGQRQRVNIARALAPSPKLLVADEPITMLDAAQRMNILYLLSELKSKRNLTVLLITHDLASARLICKRTMVMYLGKLVEQGDTEVILTKPTHPYVELILGAIPSLTTKNPYDDIPLSWIEDSANIKQGCVFEPRCRYRTEICKREQPSLMERSESDKSACYNPPNTGSG